MRKNRFAIATGLVAAVVSTSTFADPPPDVASELAALKAQLTTQNQRLREQEERITSLQGASDQSWLTERRAEEVKALVREVLADADSRASLASGVNAGYNRGFFIADDDGNFYWKFNVNSQTRYIYNNRDRGTAVTDDTDRNGFQIRRIQLNFSGYVFDPKLTYRIRLAGDASESTFRYDYAHFGYQVTDDINVQVGQLKPSFLREENIGSVQQLAAERSYTADYFTTDFAQGLLVTYWKDRLQLQGAIHDGSYSARTEFGSDRSNFAVAGRAEYVLIGDPALYRAKGWRQLSDFTAWAGDPHAVLLGGAIDFERGEEGRGTHIPDIFKWTADISGEFSPFNFFASITGQSFDDNDSRTAGGLPAALGSADQLAFVVQGGVFLIPDKLELFGRFEYIDFDGVYYRNNVAAADLAAAGTGTPDKLRIATAGVNYFINKHNTKLVFDVLYIFDAVPAANNGQGILASPDGDQIVFRSQLTFAF